MSFEKEILEHIRQHPGCYRTDLVIAIGHPDAANQANGLVREGKLERWYQGTVLRYYIPGTHIKHYMREPEAAQEDPLPLAAGLHRDGTIHIYIDEQDSGLSIGREEDGSLTVKVDESRRTKG